MILWSNSDSDKLRELWTMVPKVPLAEICKRLHRPKNSVVGHAHRMDLPQRRKSVARAKPPNRRQCHKPIGATIPSLGSFKVVVVPTPSMSPLAPPASSAQPPVYRQCQFPLNDGQPWEFCGAPSESGQSYCIDHCNVAYLRHGRIGERTYS
jgi:hypothetical protein